MKDNLGDRMKEFYESRTRYMLPRRTFTIIRIDGKAFHTYTKGLDRPFDAGLIEDMNGTAEWLCKNIQGVKLAYVQSDEISLVLSDFDTLTTSAWYDNNLQKQASVSASMATAIFNHLRMQRYFIADDGISTGNDWDVRSNFERGWDISNSKISVLDILNYLPDPKKVMACFDSRVFQIPFVDEVINYLIWRQQDATRNSISSVAQSLYSHRELEGKSSNEKQEMCFQKGVNWNDFTPREKRGGLVIKKTKTMKNVELDTIYQRTQWEVLEDTPIFSTSKEMIREILFSKI